MCQWIQKCFGAKLKALPVFFGTQPMCWCAYSMWSIYVDFTPFSDIKRFIMFFKVKSGLSRSRKFCLFPCSLNEHELCSVCVCRQLCLFVAHISTFHLIVHFNADSSDDVWAAFLDLSEFGRGFYIIGTVPHVRHCTQFSSKWQKKTTTKWSAFSVDVEKKGEKTNQ